MSHANDTPKPTPLQAYKAGHDDKPLFFLGRKQDIKDESLEALSEMVNELWEVIAKTNAGQPRFVLSNRLPCFLALNQTVELTPIAPPMLKSLLQELVYFYFCTVDIEEDGSTTRRYKTRTAPGFLLGQMLNNPLYAYPLPELERVVSAPYFTPQYQLHQQPGYHAPSKTYYHLTDARLEKLAVPKQPTPDHITAAKALLLHEVLVDFPFSSQAELANALSTMFEPFIRSWFDVTPFRLIESARAGTGKGLLGDVLLYPFLGEMPTRSPEPKNSDGWQKLITTLLLTIPSVVFFDNIKRPVNDGSLESILTNPLWGDRMLGGNQHVRLLNQATWLFAGNNVQIGEEIARRTVRIRMVAKTANPHQRKAFVHNPLRDWVTAHRKEIVTAILTLIQYWIAKGKPLFEDAPVFGSYEKWAAILHGILTVNEIPGFLGNMQEMIDLDKFDWDDITALIQSAWQLYREQTFNAADAFRLIQNDKDLLIDLAGTGERAQRCALGKLLSRNRERVFLVSDDLLIGAIPVTIEREVQFLSGGNAHRAALWRLQVLTERWRAIATPDQAQQIYAAWTLASETALKNHAVMPAEPDISVIEARAPETEQPLSNCPPTR